MISEDLDNDRYHDLMNGTTRTGGSNLSPTNLLLTDGPGRFSLKRPVSHTERSVDASGSLDSDSDVDLVFSGIDGVGFNTGSEKFVSGPRPPNAPLEDR